MACEMVFTLIWSLLLSATCIVLFQATGIFIQ